MENIKALKELCVLPAVLFVLRRSNTVTKVLKCYMKSGRLNEDEFRAVFATSIAQVEKRTKPGLGAQIGGTVIGETLTELALRFLVDKNSLLAILLSRIIPKWNAWTALQKNWTNSIKFPRLWHYLNHIDFESVSLSCQRLLCSQDITLVEEAIFSCLLVNENLDDNTQTQSRLLSLDLSISDKLTIAAVCDAPLVLNWLWDVNACHEDRECFKKVINDLALFLAKRITSEETLLWLVSKETDISHKNDDGDTLLHFAAKVGCQRLVESLLNKSADVNVANMDGKTALHKAAEQGRVNVIRLLLDKGANMEATNKSGNTALHRAVENGQEKVVELLLERGANADCENKKGRKPIHVAARFGLLNIVNMLINDASVNAKTCGNPGSTPLHFTAINDHDETAELLISRGAKIDETNSYGQTILHCAARAGSRKIVRLMISKGCNCLSKDSHGRTALHEAAWNGHHEIVNLLLKEMGNQNGIDDQNNEGCTALHLAASYNQHESVSVLLKNGALKDSRNHAGESPLESTVIKNVGNLPEETLRMLVVNCDASRRYQNEETLLHLAVKQQCGFQFLELLLNNDSVDVNAKDIFGKTSLHVAVAGGDEKVVEMLLSRGVIDVNSRMACGNTPLHVSSRNGYPSITELLLTVKNIKVNERNEAGETPLHLAVSNGNSKIVSLLLDSKNIKVGATMPNRDTVFHIATQNGDLSILRLLLTRISDKGIINARNVNNDTILDIAAKKGNVQLFDFLYTSNDNGKLFKDMSNALSYASEIGCTEIVKLICDRAGAKHSIDFPRSKDGKYPLHLAVESGNVDCTNFILEKCRNVNVITADGDGVLHSAIRSNRMEMFRLLLKNEDLDRNLRNVKNETPLCLAIKLQNNVITQLLLSDKGCDLNARFDNNGTILHLLVERNNIVVLPLLLSNNIEINCKNSDGDTGLHIAARHGHSGCLGLLLRQSLINVNSQNFSLETPFHIAISENQNEAAELLLSHADIEINIKNIDKEAPLHLAIKKKNRSMTRRISESSDVDMGARCKDGSAYLHLIIDYGPPELAEKILAKSPDINAKNTKGDTVLHVLASKENTATDVGFMRRLLAQASIDVNAENKCGETPLHIATESGNREAFQLLLANNIRNINAKGANGHTALHIAVQKNNCDFVNDLLANGADVNVQDMQFETALHLAIKKRRNSLALALLQLPDIDIDVKNNQGDAPIHLAVAIKSSRAIVDGLLNKNAHANVGNNLKKTPLHLAAARGNVAAMERILAIQNVAQNVNAIDSSGNSALHLVVSANKLQGVRLLLNNGANINAKNNMNESALCISINKRFSEISQYLLGQPNVDVTAINSYGDTLLHNAVQTRQIEIVDFLLEHGGIDPLLLNNSCETALHIAAKDGDYQMVQRFLRMAGIGAIVNVENCYGWTPLSFAAENNHWDIVIWLARYGALVNIDINGNHETPLHRAVYNENSEAVNILLQKGANTNARDIDGSTPIDYCKKTNNDAILELLQPTLL